MKGLKWFVVLLVLLCALMPAAMAEDVLVSHANAYFVGNSLVASLWKYQPAPGDEDAWTEIANAAFDAYDYTWTSPNAELQKALADVNGTPSCFKTLQPQQTEAFVAEKTPFALTLSQKGAEVARVEFEIAGVFPEILPVDSSSEPAGEMDFDYWARRVKVKAGETVTLHSNLTYDGSADNLIFQWCAFDYAGYYEDLDCDQASFTLEATPEYDGRFISVSAQVKGVAYPEDDPGIGSTAAQFVLEIKK